MTSYTLNFSDLNITVDPRLTFGKSTWGFDTGETHIELSDQTSYAVLRDGIHGFDESVMSAQFDDNATFYGRHIARKIWNERTCGFRVLIIGANSGDLTTKRSRLISALGGHGTLRYTDSASQNFYLGVVVSRGSPKLSTTNPSQTYSATEPRYQIAEIEFVASDPFLYLDRFTQTNPTIVMNQGDIPTPCTYTIPGASATIAGKTVTHTVEEGKRPVTVAISDECVTATDNTGSNCIGKFTTDSQFVMLEPGDNVVSGISEISFRARRCGI